MARHNKIGSLGEKIAAEFLEGKGFKIVSRNYRKTYGELDLVAFKANKCHFVEVKSVSWETPRSSGNGVSHETKNPLENIHPQKVQRLKRVIQVYLVSHEIRDWQFDIIAVLIDQNKRTAKVRYFEDVIL